MITSKVETITPEVALEYLNSSEGNPRYGGTNKVNQHAVSKYASDMRRGHWFIAQPIIFNSRGHLIDGHTRLNAVIGAKTSVEMLVVRGIDPSASRVIDRGTNRQLQNIMQDEGYSSALANTKTIGAIRLAVYLRDGEGKGRARCSDEYIREFASIYTYELEKAFRYCSSCQLTSNSACVEAFFEAICAGESESKLARIMEIMKEGVSETKGESATIKLRDWLKNTKGTQRSKSKADQETMSKVVQTGIKRHCDGTPTKALYPSSCRAYYTEINEKEGNIIL